MLWNSRHRPAAAGIVAMMTLVGAAPQVNAQQVFTATSVAPGGSQDAPISSASMRRYADLLELDDEQSDILKALYDGYATAADDAAAAFRDAMLRAREAFEDTGDGSVFMEIMPEARRERSETLESLEKQFFDDVFMLLTPEQAELRPRLERLRRREVMLPLGSLSGESVDLFEIVDDIDLDDTSRSGLDDVLTQYEVELDRSLVARDKVLDEGREAMGGGGFTRLSADDIAALRENAEKGREASLNVKSVNDRFARIIASQLPDDLRAAFDDAFHKESFPTVYRTSSVQTALAAADQFQDLTPEQRATIASLLEAHERQVAVANRKWAQAIEESEESGEGGALVAGPMSMMVRTDSESDPVAQARKARREVDDRTREKLLAALTEDQRARLPKRRERTSQWASDGSVVGHQVVIEIQDDGG